MRAQATDSSRLPPLATADPEARHRAEALEAALQGPAEPPRVQELRVTGRGGAIRAPLPDPLECLPRQDRGRRRVGAGSPGCAQDGHRQQHAGPRDPGERDRDRTARFPAARLDPLRRRLPHHPARPRARNRGFLRRAARLDGDRHLLRGHPRGRLSARLRPRACRHVRISDGGAHTVLRRSTRSTLAAFERERVRDVFSRSCRSRSSIRCFRRPARISDC